MKRKLLFTGVFLLSVILVKAQTYTLQDDDVVVTEGLLESCSYSFEYKNIIIPDTLDDQLVTGIKDDNYENLFYEKNLTSVQLPSGLEHVGNFAFSSNNLTGSLTIPASVRYIGQGAFNFNRQLSNVVFEPNSSIETISKWAFSSSSLTEIVLPTHKNPDFIKYIDNNGNEYAPGDVITDFNTDYYAVIPYVLTDEDVVVSNGEIQSCSYSFESKSIIIPNILDGQVITRIGDDCDHLFYNKEIVSIELPESLEYIGYSAFRDNNLMSITIPEGVKEIRNYAFWGNELASLVLPNSVTRVGEAAFRSNSLATVSLSENLTEIADYLFYDNDLTNIVLPENLRSIGFSSFISNKLTNIDIPEGVTTIKQGAFTANMLMNITIPASVSEIGARAFYGNSLSLVTFEENSNILSLGEKAFASNRLSDIILPSHSNPRFVEYSDGDGNIYAPGDPISDFETMYYASIPYVLKDDDVVVNEGVIESCSYNFESKSIIIPDTLDGQEVTAIHNESGGVFRDKGIVYVSLPSSLRTIGFDTFSENNLTAITIPEKVKEIGSYAFSYNKLNGDIILPEGITTIEQGVFRSNNITGFTIPDGVLTIKASAFYLNSITSLSIPACVTTIGSAAFQDNELDTVVFEPNSNIENIGGRAFYDNSGLTSIILPTHANPYFYEYEDGNYLSYNPGDTIKSFITSFYTRLMYMLTDEDVTVEEGVITDCSYNFAIKSIIIPDTLWGMEITGIADRDDYLGIFRNKRITSVVFPHSLRTIGESAFADNLISELDFPDSLSRIGRNAFLLNAIEELSIPEGITTIEEGVFAANSLTTLILPSGITSIGAQAFRQNQLDSVFIPNTVTYIGDYAFYDNSFDGFTLPAPPEKEGYTFRGWNGSEPGGTVTKDFTIEYVVMFVPTYYFISYVTDGGVHENADIYTIESPKVVLTDALKEGYIFNGWYGEEEFNTQVTEIPAGSKGDTTLYAQFIPDTFVITYHLDGGVNDPENPVSYTIETSNTELRDASKEGYIFEGWYSDAGLNSQVSRIFNGSIGDIELWAGFTKNTTGISENVSNIYKIYPNPVNQYFTIENIQSGTENIFIYDIFGSLVKELSVSNIQSSSRINVSFLKSGIYFLSIEGETLKFIKE